MLSGKVILVTTDGHVSAHEYLDNANASNQNKRIQELIGCDIYEHTMPAGLYSVWEFQRDVYASEPGEVISMLVDEEGSFREDREVNLIASLLYGAPNHGQPIFGNVLFIGERLTAEGPDFCSIESRTYEELMRKLLNCSKLCENYEREAE